MIQAESVLAVADNSGAKVVQCIAFSLPVANLAPEQQRQL